MTARRGRALITGGSSGIGLAFARELARMGDDLVLIGRRENDLRKAAEGIVSDFGVDAVIFPGDLADPGTPDRLVEELKARDLGVSTLVNNAGFGVPGELLDVDWRRHRDTIEVMAIAPVRLAYLLAPGMIAEGKGAIVNVSSLSALLPPHAGGTLYYPVKSFLFQFSLALRAEMHPHGVRVVAVCPGFTDTGFQAAAGGTVESVSFPKFLWSMPDRALF